MHHHYIDRFAYQDSPIHRLDPRTKILMVLAYSLVLISLPRYALPSAWYAVLPFILITWGGVPLRFVVKHTLMVSPFIVCLVFFAPIFDQADVRIGPSWVVKGGLLSAVSILVRFVLGMACLIALASTTRFPDLLDGLRKLGLPRVLMDQLSFLYRYLFLLLDQAMHLRRAQAARDGGRGPVFAYWKSNAALVGVLFIRTLEQAERTHLAMTARGYDGRLRNLRQLQWRVRDGLALAATAVYLFVLRWPFTMG